MLNYEDLSRLSRDVQFPALTIYLPTPPAGHNLENKLAFKHALEEARQQLGERQVEKEAIGSLLEGPMKLLEEEKFWVHLDEGFALFASGPDFEYHLLPFAPPKTVFIGARFLLLPVLPLLMPDTDFYVLSLSRNQVGLFRGNREVFMPVDIADRVPTGGLEEAFPDVETDYLQMHSGSSGGGGRAPVFHGQGSIKDERDTDLEKYFRVVSKGLAEVIADKKTPIILAAVEEMAAEFRRTKTFPNLLPQLIAGNPDKRKPADLHRPALEIMDNYQAEQLEPRLNDFGNLLAEGKASIQYSEILPAAFDGQVDTLFIAREHDQWGNYDHSQRRVELHELRQPEDQLLTDLAALKTVLQGGKVYFLPKEKLPYPNEGVNGVFRY